MIVLPYHLKFWASFSAKKYQISYWDSLIIAAAERAKCRKVLSEDFNSGQTYYSVLALNPFKT